MAFNEINNFVLIKLLIQWSLTSQWVKDHCIRRLFIRYLISIDISYARNVCFVPYKSNYPGYLRGKYA